MTTFADGWDEVFGKRKRKRKSDTETRPKRKRKVRVIVNGREADAETARMIQRSIRVQPGASAAHNQRLSNQRLASNEMIAVHPTQAAEAERRAQAQGIDVVYSRKTGIPSFRRYKDHDKVFVEQFKQSFGMQGERI